MSDSREESPDWLRSFQAPAQITLSSGSESPLDNSRSSDDEDSVNLSKLFQKDKASLSEAKSSQDGQECQLNKMSEVNSPIKNAKVDRTPTRKRKKENQSEKEGKSTDKVFTKRRALEKAFTDKEPSHSVLTLSSDSESSHDGSSIKVKEVLDKELLIHDVKPIKEEEHDVPSASKSPKKKLKKEDPEKKKKLESQLKEEKEDMDAVEENIPEKQSVPNLSSSRLPLVLPEKVQRTKVSFGQTEAKVEAIMSDFIQLKPQSNVYEAETMVEGQGTLDGFTFDSDKEAENLRRPASQGDQNENVDHQIIGNVKAKAKKASATEQKKGKKGVKIPNKVKKKPQAPKRSKSKK